MSGSQPGAARGWSFVGGAYRNRRHTRTVSSVVLAGAVSAMPLLLMGVQLLVPDRAAAALPGVLWLLANVALFPLARELYHRVTWPMRSNLDSWIIPLPVVAAIWVGKLFVFGMLLMLAVPLGLIGMAVLGGADRRGGGFRFA